MFTWKTKYPEITITLEKGKYYLHSADGHLASTGMRKPDDHDIENFHSDITPYFPDLYDDIVL